MRYRKKPVVVEAVVFCPEPGEDYPEGVTGHMNPDNRERPCCVCDQPWVDHGVVKTLEGDMVACPGDWIITGVKGEKYPCKPDIFELTYEAVEEEAHAASSD